VLIVDDDPLVANALRFMLEDHEVTVTTVPLKALVRLLAGERYDVILCDVSMPGMTGVELHERLRVAVPEQAARIIFVTGGAAPSTMAALERLPNVCLQKPVDPVGLRALVWRRVQGISSDSPARAASNDG
jgi:CheY-like chemotaxis protein